MLFVGLAVGVSGAAQRSVFKVGRKESAIPPSGFEISSPTVRPLRPGMSQVLDLRLTNPHPYALSVRRVTVAIVIDRAHARAGCDRGRDFRSIRMPSSTYPIRLPPRRSMTLRRLRVRVLPRVAMVAGPHNQDACKLARLSLRFGGRARRSGGARRR